MRINKCFFVLSSALWAAVFPLHPVAVAETQTGAPQAGADDVLIARMIIESGIKDSLKHFERNTRDQMAQQGMLTGNTADFLKFSQLLFEGFRAQEMYKDVYGYLRTNFDRTRFQQIREYLTSPLIRRMTRLEIKASDPAAQEETVKFLLNLELHPVSTAREALIRRLDRARGASRTALSIQTVMSDAMIKGMEASASADQRMQIQGQQEAVRRMQAAMEEQTRKGVYAMLTYTYSTVSDEDLKAYAEFCESEIGAWFNKISSDAFIFALRQAGDTLGRKIGSELPDGRSGSRTAPAAPADK